MNFIESFRRDGFTLIESAIPAPTVQACRAQLEAVFADAPDPARGDGDMYRGDVISRCPWLADLLFSDELVGRLKELLGEGYAILPETTATDSQYGGWHTDTTTAEIRGWGFRTDPDFRLLNVAFYFQGNENGGGLDVVPGSHLRPDVFVEPIRKRYTDPTLFDRVRARFRKDAPITPTGAHTVTQALGDVLLFDLRLFHKASFPVIPPAVRKFAYFVICGSDNETTRAYRRFLDERAAKDAAYAFLRGHKYPESVRSQAVRAGVNLL